MLKKFGFLIWVFMLAIVMVGLSVLAQTPAPTPIAGPPVVPSPGVGDVLLSFLGIIKSWGSLGIYGGIAAILKLLIDGLKALGIFDKIPQALQGLFVMLVGVLTVGLATLAAGGTVAQALSAALASSAGSMFLHEILQDVLGWLFPPKPAAA